MAKLTKYRITNYDGTNVTARGVFDDVRFHSTTKPFFEFTLNIGNVQTATEILTRVRDYIVEYAKGKKVEIAQSQISAEIQALLDADQDVNIEI